MECNQICKWNSNVGCVKPYGVPCILENVSQTDKKATNADIIRTVNAMKNKEPSAMECWRNIAPILPITDDFSQSVYVKTFHAFKLLEEEEKKKNGINSD